MILDTHAFVENLVAAGFKKKQAEVFVKEMNGENNDLVTKKDIQIEFALVKSDLKIEMSEIRSDIKWLKAFMFIIAGLILGLWFK